MKKRVNPLNNYSENMRINSGVYYVSPRQKYDDEGDATGGFFRASRFMEGTAFNSFFNAEDSINPIFDNERLCWD
jgi:hypothetical protein